MVNVILNFKNVNFKIKLIYIKISDRRIVVNLELFNLFLKLLITKFCGNELIRETKSKDIKM